MSLELPIVIGDRELHEFNRLLPWIFYQRDPQGRQIGYGREWPFIDGRVRALAERFDLKDKRVLEPGCLDGHITIGLCAHWANVTSFDARPPGALKTFAKCTAFGFHPKIDVWDARRMHELGPFDAIMHSGVFYHLADPVAHLRQIKDQAPIIMLDTHTAHPQRPIVELAEGYTGNWYPEYGWNDEQSGVEDKSFWLETESLFRLFNECGFDHETIMHEPNWENGPRGLFFLRKRA